MLRCLFPIAIVFHAALPAAADDVPQPSWGFVSLGKPSAEWLGYEYHEPRHFTMSVIESEWPENGQLQFTSPLAHVVTGFAFATQADGPQPFDFVYGDDAKLLTIEAVAAPSGKRPSHFKVEACDKSQQFDDGRIFFCPPEAKLSGDGAKLERSPGNDRIAWTDSAASISWDHAATRWGKYNVLLVYATASPAGAEIAVQLGDAKASGTLKSTGDWQRYTTISLGDLYVRAGQQTLSVRCTKPAGDAVMNLKAVIVVPACEGAPPVQQGDGVVTLHSRDAIVRGTVLRYEPAEIKQTLGYWVRKQDAASWQFKLEQPGLYDVEVLQGCGKGQGGSTMVVDFQTGMVHWLEFVVEDTGHFQNFKPRIVGRHDFSVAGQHELVVRPKTIAKDAACDIRQVRLLPVRQ